uniref:Uncharacterized protein n=2 Tax=Oryza TaxID=4527 RepID=A0A0D3G5C6_9ORYZ
MAAGAAACAAAGRRAEAAAATECDARFRCLALIATVLKWLQDFSDKVEERAKGVAAEVNGLLDEAVALELDMKTRSFFFLVHVFCLCFYDVMMV